MQRIVIRFARSHTSYSVPGFSLAFQAVWSFPKNENTIVAVLSGRLKSLAIYKAERGENTVQKNPPLQRRHDAASATPWELKLRP